MDFRMFHKYNRLVKRGLVRPLCCPYCDNAFILRRTEDDEPALQCTTCNSTIIPGLNVARDVRAVVEEHMPSERGDYEGPV